MSIGKPTKRAVALDLGGTRYRVAVSTLEGELEWRVSRNTDAARGLEPVLDSLFASLEEAIAAAGGREAVSGLGIAAPGPVDPWNGVLYSPPNMPGWVNVPLKHLFEERFGIHSVAGNDANLAAVGEHRFGAGRGLANVVYVTVSTGIGGGVISDNRLLVGSHGFAGEIGHMTVELHGDLCACGNWGCLEALASGTAIARHARETVQSGADTALRALAMEQITAKAVTDEAYRGDKVAQRLLKEAAEALGVGIVNLAHLFNPSRIILGGGVSINAGPIFWDTIQEVIEARMMRPALRDLEIVPAGLGDDAGLLGAAAAALDEAATDSSNQVLS
ncbi:MAG TPA: ROK family protein [Chloroflexota bacterium]